MPQLVKRVQGEVIDVIIGEVVTSNPIVGEVGTTDYIHLNGITAYIQNFDRVVSSETLSKPLLFGLKNTQTEVVLEISY
jgi:hypothetical protein